MWEDYDADEAFRRISLIAFAIFGPLLKLIELADDHLPTPIAVLVLMAPWVLAQWFLPTWVYGIPLIILAVAGAWVLMVCYLFAIRS